MNTWTKMATVWHKCLHSPAVSTSGRNRYICKKCHTHLSSHKYSSWQNTQTIHMVKVIHQKVSYTQSKLIAVKIEKIKMTCNGNHATRQISWLGSSSESLTFSSNTGTVRSDRWSSVAASEKQLHSKNIRTTAKKFKLKNNWWSRTPTNIHDLGVMVTRTHMKSLYVVND